MPKATWKIGIALPALCALLGLGLLSSASAGTGTATTLQRDTPFGSNESAGRFVRLNGIRLYFETYGEGPPMLLLHGNGQDISAMSAQIRHFSARYRVIAPDSRGHGRSEIGPGRLTYEQMAEDVNALLEELGLKQVLVLGWSDGGIVGLLLAIQHPDKVGKLAIMGANLNPEGAYDWARAWVMQREQEADAALARGDNSIPWALYKQRLDLLGRQPNIAVEKLKGISAPTLVMAGDRDVIRPEHTLEIFNALPKAHLCIFPGATHMIPEEDPVLFNQTVETFFRKPFSRPYTKSMFASLPLLEALPTAESLGTGWSRHIALLFDPASDPHLIVGPMAQLPDCFRKSLQGAVNNPTNTISGWALADFFVRSTNRIARYELQLNRYRSKEKLVEDFDRLLASNAKGYQKLQVQGIGDAAVAFRDQGGMTLWFRKGSYRVSISPMSSGSSWEGDTELRWLAKEIAGRLEPLRADRTTSP